MFGMDDTKIQGDEAPQSVGQPEDVYSPDTRRDKRFARAVPHEEMADTRRLMALPGLTSPSGRCAFGAW